MDSSKTVDTLAVAAPIVEDDIPFAEEVLDVDLEALRGNSRSANNGQGSLTTTTTIAPPQPVPPPPQPSHENQQIWNRKHWPYFVVLLVLILTGIIGGAMAAALLAVSGKNSNEGVFTPTVSPSQSPTLTSPPGIATGRTFSCKIENSIKCWGRVPGFTSNAAMTTSGGVVLSPLTIPEIRNTLKLSIGTWHACAVDPRGSVWCFGDVPGMVENVIKAIAVAATESFTFILESSGTIKKFGNQVTTEIDGIVNAAAVSTSDDSGCAVLHGGTIACWGKSYDGQLGNGIISSGVFPAMHVVGINSGATVVDHGYYHVCAVVFGSVKCWGSGYNGRTGNNVSTEAVPLPVDVIGIPHPVLDLALGADFSCALLQTGSVYCWGGNYYGQLGDGTFEDKYTAVQVVGLTNIVSISTAYSASHVCALDSTGTTRCWGNNELGTLGEGTKLVSGVPVNVLGVTDAVSIAVDHTSCCAVTSSGTVHCWGLLSLGIGSNALNAVRLSKPVEIAGVHAPVSIAATYPGRFCAVLPDASLKCWDPPDFTHITNDVLTPQLYDIPNVTTGVRKIVAGDDHFCALMVSQEIKCFGNNFHGQLGDGTKTNSYDTGVTVVGISDAVDISAADSVTCAIVGMSRNVKCWGQLYGLPLSAPPTVHLVPNLSGVTSLAVASQNICVVYGPAGAVACLSPSIESVPATVNGISGASMVVVGTDHACALVGSTVYCWGDNRLSQLGDGTRTIGSAVSFPARQVPGLTNVVAISADGAGATTCAIVGPTNSVQCWGSNEHANLGDGDIPFLPQPVPVIVADI